MKRKLVFQRKNELPVCQQQQAISIYFFLEGLGFRALGFGFIEIVKGLGAYKSWAKRFDRILTDSFF